MSKQIKRWQKNVLEHSLKNRRVIVISGARQCGKTTLAKQIMTRDVLFRTLDDKTLLKTAIDDPNVFVKHSSATLIIDEIQKAPELLPAIKMVVDENNKPGQFLLTGSADIQTLHEVSESLAGRIKNIRLRQLSQGEILLKTPRFIENCFSQNFPDQIKDCDKKAVIDLAFRGGYPEIINFSQKEIKEWHKDYIKTILKRDLKNIANIERADVIEDLFAVLNSWSGKFMDYSNIGANLAISRITLKTYINVLYSLFLFDKVKPWIKTDYDRVGKKSKIYASDSGLMASVLNWKSENVLLDSDKSGKLIETFVFNELSAQLDLDSGYNIYHYRDRLKREIDFIVENGEGELLLFEVKASESVGKNDFTHIKWFKENMFKDKKSIGIVLYCGQHVLSFGKRLYAVPIAFLWN